MTDWAAVAADGPLSDKERSRYAKLVDKYRVSCEREHRERMKLESRLIKKSKPIDILVIPDAHADESGESNDRFTWAGKLAVKLRPSVVIQLGDWGDWASLCSYERPGSSQASTRSVLDDIASSRDAVEKLTAPIRAKKNYSPRLIALDGNHEYRVIRATTSEDMRWEDVLHLKLMGREDNEWEVYPYEVPITLNGITFCHHLSKGNSRYPIAGKYMAANLLAEGGSAVVGHSHILNHHEGRRWDGAKRFALSAGCYFERDLDWAKGSNDNWWRGCVVLRDAWDGYATVEPVPLARIKAEFGE